MTPPAGSGLPLVHVRLTLTRATVGADQVWPTPGKSDGPMIQSSFGDLPAFGETVHDAASGSGALLAH